MKGGKGTGVGAIASKAVSGARALPLALSVMPPGTVGGQAAMAVGVEAMVLGLMGGALLVTMLSTTAFVNTTYVNV